MMTRGFRNLLKKPLLRASVMLACFLRMIWLRAVTKARNRTQV